MRNQLTGFAVLVFVIAFASLHVRGADTPFIFGGDISALPELEKLGAIYRDNHEPGDAITILMHHGMNLFRVRLFVNPQNDFSKNAGATQDLAMILRLATRIKHGGAQLSLALHYSDTWADPAHQSKPAQWAGLEFPALKQRVAEYTASVLQAMKQNQTLPDIVEIGNETTAGMLWPDGKITADPGSWDRYAELSSVAIQTTRSQLPRSRILIHIDSGGRPGVPGWFFTQLNKRSVDFDIVGLSFYPTFKDSLAVLKTNLREVAAFGKPILIIETSYPWRAAKQTAQTTWPMTPEGQRQFMSDLTQAVKTVPNHLGEGIVWWYPEAVPVTGQRIWDGGAQGLFDREGNVLLR